MDRSQPTKTKSNFLVDCHADQAHRFLAEADSVWVNVGQRVRLRNMNQIWESIAVECKEQEDGSLLVRVLVFNPDWDEPLQIASIQSRPHDASCLTALGCNLNHVVV
ncbi:MAG: hypothetical protein ACREQ5_09005 [Candidatus Dormibacteria bacterium]